MNHIISNHITPPNCANCEEIKEELRVAKEKVILLDETEEDLVTVRIRYVEKEKEIVKLMELHAKENEKDGLDRLKLEDTLRRLTMENENLNKRMKHM